MNREPGPLRLEPVFLPKVWAAPEFPSPLKEILQPPPHTGEVWLASDRHQVTPVASGEMQGLGLDQVIERWPAYILGKNNSGSFPLLLKFLSVGSWLSVQVHPDDDQAREMEGEPWGKSEAWYMLAALPGAEIILGLAPGADRGALKQAVAQGQLPELLAKVPVAAGQCFALPAGTVHAAGPGMFFFEVQQASDVTYRFYDWDRLGDDGKPRPLHVDKALAVMQVTGPGRPQPPQKLSPPPFERTLLINDPHFRLLKCRLDGEDELPRGDGGPSLIFVMDGGGALSFPGGEHETQELKAGQTWLLPAGLAPARLGAADDGIMYLESLAPGA